MRGGPACRAESEGGRAVRCLRTSGRFEAARDAPELGDGAGEDGGATLFGDDAAEVGGAGGVVLAFTVDIAPLALPSPTVPDAAVSPRTPATAEPIPVAAIDPTAIAPPAKNADVPTKSPPESAGEPPRTAANNFLGQKAKSVKRR